MRSFANLLGLALTLQGSLLLAQGDVSAARTAYNAIHAREIVLRGDMDSRPGAPALLLPPLRNVVGEYERMSRAFPMSGFSDNALFQAATLSADAFWNFGEEPDRAAALRLFADLGGRFPSSSLNRQVESQVSRLRGVKTSVRLATSVPGQRDGGLVALRSVHRESLPDTLRVTLELDREITFHEERLDGPPRVFIDLRHTSPVSPLRDAALTYTDDVVRHVRVGRPQGDVTRVVFDLQGVARHSVYVLYDPYRLVIDFERAVKGPPRLAAPELLRGAPIAAPILTMTPSPRIVADKESEPTPIVPSTNINGGFSLSRQLGLGISRIVIDAGHGGHDPGARIKGLSEADLVLDIALRLEKLLSSQTGVTVVLTRKSNVYIPLEQRTAIANREEADLFLSIHANASEDERARGIETYFLNFAPNPQAEKIAARENSGGSRTMHSLPDIVKAIALNNKIDESRDFAALIQGAMYERLRKANREIKDLGVKQAPFMVLIGAQMPSVLAEISFITNKDEGALLKTPTYRQQIAEALLNGIMKYQKAVKATGTVAKKAN